MTRDEAQKWIEEKVVWGLVDPRTLSPPPREIVLHFQATPDDQSSLIEALRDFLTHHHLRTSEQVENAAYLVVNFGDRGLLDLLVSKLTKGETSDDFRVRIAMAAIRSFPGFDAGRNDVESQGKSDFLPFLIDCLRDKVHAGLAYEILSQFYPDDMTSYFLWALAHHSSDVTLIQTMLTDLYFDQREEAPGASALGKIRGLLSQLASSIVEHPLLPKEAKAQLTRTDMKVLDLETRREGQWASSRTTVQDDRTDHANPPIITPGVYFVQPVVTSAAEEDKETEQEN